MSHKYLIVLRGPAADQLDQLAAATGEPPTTLAAQLVCHGLTQAAGHGKIQATRQPPIPTGTSAGRAWLQPPGGDEDWQGRMWGSIAAMHARYPKQLRYLQDRWWEDEAETEKLCALTVWRHELDENGSDPRDELAFQTQLKDYARELHEEHRGLADTWNPDNAPDFDRAG